MSQKNVAKAYEQAGAEFIHVVDLDGAKKSQTCQFETIEKLLEIGVDRVVVSSLAVKDIALTKKFLRSMALRR
ncbi:HisA/HisF-related TIM barrel protein [Francisella orientalis]|uniref:HisA/HisF-related TIM barrel protein n=1 Tax=Francisella orientalis TaxID=299583 RepID=UPI001E47510F|nr:HisA/HisF-related TIM barrel protein [Francisella orientalis]